MNIPPLSIIIVTWNGLKHLPRCLAALVAQLPADAEVIQVDNGSTDGTAAWVRANYPAVRLIELTTNTGFAGGVAIGLQAARGELILLINDDAFAEPGCIAALLAAMAAHPEAGAAAAVLVFDHRPDVVASAGIRVRRDALALDVWALQPVSALPDAPQAIFGPSGGAALYRRTLLNDVGGLEPAFFAYLEDVDLAWRMQLRGWHSISVPQARLHHIYSATGGQNSPFKQWLLARNRVRTIVRCLPGPLLLRLLPQILAYDLLAASYALLRLQPAILAGRVAAIAELPRLLHQRRAIQRRRTASIAALSKWLEPAPPPWVTAHEVQQLNVLLQERKNKEQPLT